MNDEQLKNAKEQIEKAKEDAIASIKQAGSIDDKGMIASTFVLFNFVDGQPAPPITLGVDKDIFALVSQDFINMLDVRTQEEKINTIKDERLRARLLNNLHNSLK